MKTVALTLTLFVAAIAATAFAQESGSNKAKKPTGKPATTKVEPTEEPVKKPANAGETRATDKRATETLDTAPTPSPDASVHAPDASVLERPAVTADMWFYEQEKRRHEDPKQIVRAKAKFRAEQRMKRMAASAWYGISPSRPVVSETPHMSVYGHAWVANSHRPYSWNGVTRSNVVVLSRRGGYGLW